MKNENIFIFALLAICGLIIIVDVAIIGLNNKINRRTQATVYTICNEARTTNNISENACGNIQDRTNSEFLCTQRNASLNNFCWVEVKL